MNLIYLGNCRDEKLIEHIFGSVTDFAREVEERGDNFIVGDYCVKYNEETDIHSFFEVEK